MTRFVDLPPDGYEPPTYDTDHPAEQTDADYAAELDVIRRFRRAYEAGHRDGVQAAAWQLDRLADSLTNRGEEYKAAIVQQCVWVVRTTGTEPPDLWTV